MQAHSVCGGCPYGKIDVVAVYRCTQRAVIGIEVIQYTGNLNLRGQPQFILAVIGGRDQLAFQCLPDGCGVGVDLIGGPVFEVRKLIFQTLRQRGCAQGDHFSADQ